MMHHHDDDDDVRSFVYFQTFLIQISVISIQLTTKVTKVLISDVLFRICKKKVSTWFDFFLSFFFHFLICIVVQVNEKLQYYVN